MKSIIIAGTVITNKQSALSLMRKINNIIVLDSFEAGVAINAYEEKLVNSGFVTWEDIECCY